MKNSVTLLFVAVGLTAVSMSAADFSGTFLNDESGLEVTLQAAPDGSLTGRMSADGDWATIKGRITGDTFAGQFTAKGTTLPLSGRLHGDRLELVPGPADDPEETWVLQRANTGENVAVATPPPTPTPVAPQAATPPAATSSPAGTRKVVVNGVTLPADTLQALEQQYHIRIEDADYWYDAKCGAWGLRGGPTLGFIPAGLKLGGPLAADASGTGTGVFLNGREAHAQDVLALQSILGQVLPGRYFVDAQGNAGYEGGPPLVNLVVAAQQQASRQPGNWHSKVLDAGGAWDGNGSGYVMGHDASGKAWSASY